MGSHQNSRSLEEDEAFFTMRSKDSETTHFQAAAGVASQQRLRPRRFDSIVKHVPKLLFKPVSFQFLVCFSIERYLYRFVRIGLKQRRETR